jgi:hypothetical protein
MDFVLIGFTFWAWLIHSIVAWFYSKKFESTKHKNFRITHALEIFITVSVMVLIYSKVADSVASVPEAILTVLGTLIVLDLASLILFDKLREKFDIRHFLMAYGAVVLAVVSML